MKKEMLLIFAVMFILPTVSAEILVSQPQTTYALGDSMSLSVTLKPTTNVVDFLSLHLVCPNGEVEIYKTQFDLDANEERVISISNILSSTLVGGLRGDCSVKAKFGPDSTTTQKFDLSDEINVDFSLSKGKYLPGEAIFIQGSAKRFTGAAVTGFLEIKIENINVFTTQTVQNGVFSANVTIPANAPAGKHTLSVKVYEKDASGTNTNQGTSSETVEVAAVLKLLEVKINPDKISPGQELSYVVYAFDQSGKEIVQDINLVIYRPGESVFQKKIVAPKQTYTLSSEKSMTPDYWKIEASANGVVSKKLFYVEEKESATFSLENSTLVVVNTGNVLYAKEIEVVLNGNSTFVNVSVAVGETKKYQMHAPDGEYVVEVREEGGELQKLGSSFITGNVIGVGELGQGISQGFSSPVVWGLLVLLLLLIIVYIYVRGRKANPPLQDSKISLKRSFMPAVFNKERGDVGIEPAARRVSMPVISSAQDSVGNGKKELATFVVLKVNNITVNEYAQKAVESALMVGQSSGAHIYIDGLYRTMVFSPIVTKKMDNEVIAMKVAMRMKDILDEHNKRFKDKLEYGIGVSNGNIISEMQGSKFTFVASDSGIVAAKKLTLSGEGHVLVSETVRSKIMSHAKTEKHDDNSYKVVSVSSKEKYGDFLKGFSERQNRDR